MPEFDPNAFERSAAGQVLKRLAESESSAGTPPRPAWDLRDLSSLHELERLGYVRIVRGAGAMSWKIERVDLTDAGRQKATLATG